MVFPLIPAIATTSFLLSLKALVDFKVRPFTNKLIAGKIEEVKGNLRDTVIDISKTYCKDFYFTAMLDAAMLLFAFIVFLLFKTSMISITLFSISIIVITARYIISMVKNIRLLVPYFPQIRLFVRDALRFRSPKTAVRIVISNQFQKFYNENTTALTRNIHGFGARFGVVKSMADIESDLINGLFLLADERPIKKAVYPVVAITLFYGTFAFLLKLFVFSVTVKMNTVELVLYPFRVLLSGIFSVILPDSG